MSKCGPLKPGTKSPVSGTGNIVGPRGGKTGLQTTVIENKPVPPTQKPGQTVVVPKPTKHKHD
jgi:hypothetical protein